MVVGEAAPRGRGGRGPPGSRRSAGRARAAGRHRGCAPCPSAAARRAPRRSPRTPRRGAPGPSGGTGAPPRRRCPARAPSTARRRRHRRSAPRRGTARARAVRVEPRAELAEHGLDRRPRNGVLALDEAHLARGAEHLPRVVGELARAEPPGGEPVQPGDDVGARRRPGGWRPRRPGWPAGRRRAGPATATAAAGPSPGPTRSLRLTSTRSVWGNQCRSRWSWASASACRRRQQLAERTRPTPSRAAGTPATHCSSTSVTTPSAPSPTRAAAKTSGSISAEQSSTDAVREHEGQPADRRRDALEPGAGAVGARGDGPADRLAVDVAEVGQGEPEPPGGRG